MQGIKTVFANIALKRLLVAQLPADFADWLDFAAIGVLLSFHWNAEPMVFAFLAVAMGLPYILVGPLAGALIDRSPIRAVLIASNLGRAVATVALAFAANWQALLLFVLLRSVVDAFFTPARQAALQALAPPEARMAANGISHALNQASKILAPALGGGLMVFFAPREVFFLNAGFSLLAAALLARLPRIERPQSETGAATGFTVGWRDNLADIAAKPALRGALLMMAAGYFAMFFYDTLIAPLTKSLGFDATALGLSLSAVGAGGVFGAVVLSLGRSPARPFRWIGGGALLSAGAVIPLGLAEALGLHLSLPLYLGLFGLAGFATALSIVPIRTIIQTETPAHSIARVTALSEAVNTAALLTAPFLGAWVAGLTSVGLAFVLGGVLLILNVAYALRVEWRILTVDDRPR